MSYSINPTFNDRIFGQVRRNESSFATHVERLTTGLRINRAADDPAGLVISERYRAQVDGLQAAVRNLRDSASLVRTADSGIDGIVTQLRAIRTIALHAASTATSDASSIRADQEQIVQAIATIDQIASTTQFGSRNLLDGSSGVAYVSGSPSVTVLSGGQSTTSGTHAVDVQQAATQGVMDGAGVTRLSIVGSGGRNGVNGEVWNRYVGNGPITLHFTGSLAAGVSDVIINPQDDRATLKSKVDAAFAAAGHPEIVVEDDGTNMSVVSSRIGGGGPADLTVTESDVVGGDHCFFTVFSGLPSG